MRVAIYGRVSTSDQNPESQLVALRTAAAQRGYQIVEEYVDQGYSGAKAKRPALDRLMRDAWGGKFQLVLVFRFDRFARSVRHLVSALEEFRSLKIGFISLSEQLDTSTPIGTAMFTIIGAMAQLERDIISERVSAGMRAARAAGITVGRPVRAIDLNEVGRLLAAGKSLREIARTLHIPRTTLTSKLRATDQGAVGLGR